MSSWFHTEKCLGASMVKNAETQSLDLDLFMIGDAFDSLRGRSHGGGRSDPPSRARSGVDQFAMRSCERRMPISLKVVTICVGWVSRKNLLVSATPAVLPAQYCSTEDVASLSVLTCTV